MIYSENEARQLVLKAGMQLVKRGLIARTWGNISAKISDDQFIITPTGRTYDSLSPEELVKVNCSDLSYEGHIKPSSEKGIHARCYLLRKDCGFVIHTHQYYASIAGLEEKDYPFAASSSYGMPGTKKLCENISAAIEANPGQVNFFMPRHGSLSLGRDYDDAFSNAEALEKACKKEVETAMSLVQTDTDLDTDPDFMRRLELLIRDEYGFDSVVLQQDADTVEVSRHGRTLSPYIDDFAMIAGADVLCTEKSLMAALKALKGRNAVLIKNMGAVCVAGCEDDAKAVAMITAKNCACERYAGAVPGCRGVGPIESRIQRAVYQQKYSKQNNLNR